MTDLLTPTQALLMFGLLARHGTCAQADLLPRVTKADREALATARLCSAEKQGRAYRLTLTDAGWAWAANNLTAELPPVQRLLGHSSIKTTTIYTEACGPEEQAIVARFWDDANGKPF